MPTRLDFSAANPGFTGKSDWIRLDQTKNSLWITPAVSPPFAAMRTALPVLLLMTISTFAQLTYPASHKGDVVDDYHGTKIADPYRWLEDDNSAETKAWVAEQNKVTFGYLEKIPQRAQFKDRLTKLWNYERFGIPSEHGGRYFFSRNSGLQNQSVLYVADSLTAEPRELLDPNGLSKDGTVSLSMTTPSEDGKYLAYGLSKAGSDWVEFRVRDVETGKDHDDELKWIKFSDASWAKDGSGFYYGRYPAPKDGAAMTQKNENKRVYFHKLGTKQEEDPVVYARPDRPEWGYDASVTDDGRYLVITISQGTDPRNRVFYKDLSKHDSEVVELLNDFDADYSFIDNDGPVFFFKTDLDAPRYRLIAIDTTQPDRKQWRTLIPQNGDKLEGVSLVGDQFICEYLHDARSLVQAHDLEGKLMREIQLPGIGTAGGFGGKRSHKETFYSFSSFTSPGVIYRYDIASGKSTVYRKPKIDFDASPFETKQVFVTSKDGTKVPMFITHRKDLKLDASTPCLLYGYGGFNISLTPGFSVSRAVWLEHGGILAVANLRGGGEYGADWHKAGTKLQKQNVFDDFISCAEWLIKERYTQTPKLAIQGGSNGGLLVGACITQRPELFGAAIPAVGVMDMLRFHQFTIGWAWKSDYGSSEDPKEFAAIRAYSPLHNLKPGTKYPATLIATSDHDDRVVPAHSFKFAATLQERQAKDGPPVLIRIETSAGHGAGTALNKMIETTADEWAFLAKALGME
ncbi:MAG: prolyl endopeptidase [Verrucomicrobiaceae bacterium]|nr:prolyl endopeptidase [Verrucomicrobiaceae bacterium]